MKYSISWFSDLSGELETMSHDKYSFGDYNEVLKVANEGFDLLETSRASDILVNIYWTGI